MKTKHKILFEWENQFILKNSNFLNSQNYIISKKIKIDLFYNYIFDFSYIYEIIKYNLFFIYYLFIISLLNFIFFNWVLETIIIVVLYAFISNLIIIFFNLVYQFFLKWKKIVPYKIYRKKNPIIDIKNFIVVKNKKWKLKS